MAIVYNYWRLYCRISNIPICRKCGKRLDNDYQKRRHGHLCRQCYVKNQ